MALVISTRAVGRRKPLRADFSVEPPEPRGEGDDRTLRDVIEHVVRSQVAAFTNRQESNRFDRVLSARTIEEGAVRGRIDPTGKSLDQDVDIEGAVASALLAFEDGLYLVVIDEVEQRDLDAVIRLTPTSRLTFLRLTFLAGA